MKLILGMVLPDSRHKELFLVLLETLLLLNQLVGIILVFVYYIKL
jgi:hypothetical protein